MSSPTLFFVGTARSTPTIPQTRPRGVWVRLVVKTTWSPTACLTALHQSRSTARICAYTTEPKQRQKRPKQSAKTTSHLSKFYIFSFASLKIGRILNFSGGQNFHCVQMNHCLPDSPNPLDSNLRHLPLFPTTGAIGGWVFSFLA